MKLDLQGEKLIVVATENSPHVLKQFMTQKDVSKVGYEMKLLQELSDKFNFTYQLIDTKGDTGGMRPNGTWSGLVGMLVDEKADIGFGGLTITPARLQVVDFLTPPHFSSAITFITTWPKHHDSVFMIRIDIWIIVSVFFSVILIMFTMKFLSCYFEELKKFPLYWTILVIALRQDMNRKMTKRHSLRIIIFSWLFASLIVSVVLGGFIYKSFSVPRTLQTIDSLVELAEEMKLGKIDVLINKNSARYTELKNSNRDEIKVIHDYVKFLEKGQKGTQLVRNSKKPLGYIDYRSKFEYELHKKGQNTYFIALDDPDSVIRNAFFAFAVKKGFKYRKIFAKHVKNMATTGLIMYWLRQAKYGGGFVYDTDEEDESSKDADSEQGAIFKTVPFSSVLMYGVGISFSILVFLFEMVFMKLKLVQGNRTKKSGELVTSSVQKENSWSSARRQKHWLLYKNLSIKPSFFK